VVDELPSAVIVDPAFLGDVVFDAPLVRALKERRGAKKVGIVVRPPAHQLAERIAGIDRVHVFDKRGSDRGIRGLLRVAAEIQRENYMAALIPHPSPRSALLAWWAGIARRIGSSEGWIARRTLTEHKPEHPSDTFVSARLRLLGDELAEAEELAGTLVNRGAREASGKLRLGLALGSEWETKRWSIDQAAALCASLDRERVQLVLLGAAKEAALYDELGRRTDLRDAERAVGGSVGELVDRIASLDVLIAGDTGPLHVARALNVSVIALFGPTSEKRHAFAARDVVLKVDIACRPCSAHGDRVCPEGHHRCMRELGAEKAFGALKSRLEVSGR
jgi:heptosyltransferase-2